MSGMGDTLIAGLVLGIIAGALIGFAIYGPRTVLAAFLHGPRLALEALWKRVTKGNQERK